MTMIRIFDKNKPVRLTIFFASVLVIGFSCLYATYHYFEGHAIHVLSQYESPDGKLMIIGKSDGVFSGWKMQLYYKKQNEPWAVYFLSREDHSWKQVKIKESNDHANISVSDKLAAALDLHSLLLDNPLQNKSATPPMYLVKDENPFNKSAVINPGDSTWPSKCPMPAPVH